MTINFFKSFFLGITCSLFMSCHSYEAPSMQMPFIEIAMQSVSNHPIITIAVSIFFIKYFILNPALNYIIEHNGSVFLANILYYMGARVNAALLWKACHKNETDPALRCLRFGADPQRARPSYDGPLLPSKAFADNWRPWNYCTNALQLACGFRDEKLVKALLNAGADVNDDDFSYSRSRPSTPIGFSLEQQKLDTQIYEINDNIINTLLEHGALLGCLQANDSDREWNSKDLCETFKKLSSRKQITIPEKAIENAVNYILFITKRYDYSLSWLWNDPTFDNFYFLFDRCNDQWIYHLCNMIHEHIKNEEKRNALLLKLYNIETDRKYQHKIQSNIIKSILINNNNTLIQRLEKEKNYDTYYINSTNTLLPLAFQQNNKISAKQFYYFYQKREISLNKMWENAATMNTTCLKTLLKLSGNPQEILQKKNEFNQSIFYLAITHNDSFREKALQYVTKHPKKPEIFLTQEIKNVIEIKECTKLDIFLQFYNDNNELQKLIRPVAQKAKQQYDVLCYQHQENLSVCHPSFELKCLENIYLKLEPYI